MMNSILQANMQAIINSPPVVHKKERGVMMRQDSKSLRIIDYLFKKGKVSGKRIMQDLGLPNSPKSYIQKHIRTGRVICELVDPHRALYSISEDFDREDFNLT